MSNDTRTEVISARVSQQRVVALDLLAPRWGVDRSKAVAKLVEAVDSPELVQLVEQVTFVRQPTLPKSWKYRVVADFKTLFGITDITLRRGQILSLDGYERSMLEKLYARGLMIEPIA